jgi:hypothetical protein
MVIKKIVKIVFLLSFLTSLANAEEGKVRIGAELGWSPVDLEAEDTAQKIANASGSTVVTEYSTGVLVGRLFADYGLSDNLYGEIGYFQTSGAEATYKIGSDSAKESYDVHGLDISAKFVSDAGFFGKFGMHSTTIDGALNLTIGGTSYSATGEAQGTGILFGGGFESDGTLYSIIRYNDVGGISDFTFLSVGFVF